MQLCVLEQLFSCKKAGIIHRCWTNMNTDKTPSVHPFNRRKLQAGTNAVIQATKCKKHTNVIQKPKQIIQHFNKIMF